MFTIVHNTHALTKFLNDNQLTSSNIDMDTLAIVSGIQDQVVSNGNAALKQLTQAFDHVDIDELLVSEAAIKQAYHHVDAAYVQALTVAAKNIYEYHDHQRPVNWEDANTDRIYGVQYTALEAVGLYVPGGRAAYPSSVLMTAIPAKIAGCDRLVMTSPPTGGDIPAAVLVAADIGGVTEVYRVGGAQAIFALAHGTEDIRPVHKIVGPGNKYVTAAKQMVYGTVDIDKPAGPSEVCVVIDDAAYVAYAAAECLAQLEHDPDASAIVIASSDAIAKAVNDAAVEQVCHLSRRSIIQASKQHAAIAVIPDEDDRVIAINQVASEHLVLLVHHPMDMRRRIRHAGAIFCGPYSPVTLGDYYAGPNHVLPTAGAARFASPLGVMDFMKYSSYLQYTKPALKQAAPDMASLTSAEGFDAHMQAVNIRFSGE